MADKWVELSDDQIDTLLAEAETRLSSQEKNDKNDKNPSQPSKLEVAKPNASSSSSKPNAINANAATALNAHKAAASSDSKAKEGLSVRVPEARKSKKQEVCGFPPPGFSSCTFPLLSLSLYARSIQMMKIISQIQLKW